MPADTDSFSTLLAAGFEQGNRLLDLTTPLGANRLLAQDMRGEDRLSNGGYCLDITALSQDAHVPLKDLLGQPAQLSLQTAMSRSQPRIWNGHVTAVSFQGANGGMARYRLRLEPWLAFLRHRRDSFVFQDKTVCDIVDSIFGDYKGQGKLVPQWRWDLKDREVYAKRSLTTQYRETDFDFVERLLAEEGMFYWIEHEAGSSGGQGSHTVVIADFNDAFKAGPQESVRFHRADATETEDTMQQWGKSSRWQTNGVTLASWDYRSARNRVVSAQAPAGNVHNQMSLVDSDYPGQYAFEDDNQGDRLANNALAALRVPAQMYQGAGTVRTLAAGQRFELTDHFGSGGDGSEYLVLAVKHQARNNLDARLGEAADQLVAGAGIAAGATSPAMGAGATGAGASNRTANAGPTTNTGSVRTAVKTADQTDFYTNEVAAIPSSVEYRAMTVDGHGARVHPRPTVFGTQTALVVGGDDPVHTDRDHRVRVQFHWQRGASSSSRLPHPAGEDNAPAKRDLGTWVRVAAPVAGGDWGGHFVPRVGQEVLVQFLHGDIDRPVVVGSVYNGAGSNNAAFNQIQSGAARSTGNAPAWFAGDEGANAHNAVLSGFKSQALGSSAGGTGGYNQLVMDDTPGQSRLTASTTQGDSRLNLGHVIEQSDNQRLDDLGYGAELASRESVALRGGSGLLVSADARPNATGGMLDSSEAATQVDLSGEQANTLAKAALKQGAKLDDDGDDPTELPALKALAHTGEVLRHTETKGAAGASTDTAAQGSAGGDGSKAGARTAFASSGGEAASAGSGASSASAASDAAPPGESAVSYSEPHLQFSAPSGIGQYTPGDALTVAGGTLTHVAPDVNWTALGDVVATVAGGVVLYTSGAPGATARPASQQGILLHAAAGKVRVHSAKDVAALAAQKKVTIGSTHAAVDVDAKTKFLATAGGAYLRLEGGAMHLHAPGKVQFKSGSHSWQGPQNSQASASFSGGPLCDARVRGAAQGGGAVVPLT